MKIGVVIADRMEYEAFLSHWSQGELVHKKLFGLECVSIKLEDMEICAVLGLIGKVNITAATSFLIAQEKPEIIINTGYSGAVHGLRRGDLVIGTSYVECDFDMTAIGFELGHKPDCEYIHHASPRLLKLAQKVFDAKSAPLGTGDMFLTSNEVKRKFYEAFSIAAFDMESAAVASVCELCGVEFISIRKVSDDSEDSAVNDYREMNESNDTCFSEILSRMVEALKTEG